VPKTRDHILPSGAKLSITTATFERALELFKAYSEEMKNLPITEAMSVGIMEKNLFCTLIDSKRVENALKECMKSVRYDGGEVSLDTFKEPEKWGDYVDVLWEVAGDNLNPFMKNLSARFPAAAGILKISLG
jgi:hypothetical protein